MDKKDNLFKSMNDKEAGKAQFWNGRKNKSIRFYFYAQKGLQLLNEFRYLIMVILVMYQFLKIDNILLIPLMFAVCVPVLILLGWMSVHHMDKVMEYLHIQYATHFSRYNIDLQENQLKALQSIDKKTPEDQILKNKIV